MDICEVVVVFGCEFLLSCLFQKKKKLNKGEAQRKKVAKILANPKAVLKTGKASRGTEMALHPEPSPSSVVSTSLKNLTGAKRQSTINSDELPTSKVTFFHL